MKDYLSWLIRNTRTSWWHDSADPAELDEALAHGAVGVTTNPYLANLALTNNRRLWAAEIEAALAVPSKAEALMRVAVTRTAARMQPMFDGVRGWVCGQVNPLHAGDREAMLAMARRYHTWAPNITVKLPATAAGLDVMEECVASGIAVTLTVSFTVPQVIAIAERYRKAAARATVAPGRCFAVIMIGRLDDYLREVALDTRAPVSEADIRQAGIAVVKRALPFCRGVTLIVAALRGTHHATELAGGDLTLSIAPAFQKALQSPDIPCEERFARPVAVERLCSMPEFRRAYEPDGMKPEEFISYGVTQRTLAQFAEVGWKLMEAMK
jgi:transaldolase